MTAATPLMAGKRGLVMGIANDHSLAYGIARAVAAQGAALAVDPHPTSRDEVLARPSRTIPGLRQDLL